jgi:hypothetical protein
MISSSEWPLKSRTRTHQKEDTPTPTQTGPKRREQEQEQDRNISFFDKHLPSAQKRKEEKEAR